MHLVDLPSELCLAIACEDNVIDSCIAELTLASLSAWLNPQALTYFLIDHYALASFNRHGNAVSDCLIQGPTLLAAIHPKCNMTVVDKGNGPFPGVSDV